MPVFEDSENTSNQNTIRRHGVIEYRPQRRKGKYYDGSEFSFEPPPVPPMSERPEARFKYAPKEKSPKGQPLLKRISGLFQRLSQKFKGIFKKSSSPSKGRSPLSNASYSKERPGNSRSPKNNDAKELFNRQQGEFQGGRRKKSGKNPRSNNPSGHSPAKEDRRHGDFRKSGSNQRPPESKQPTLAANDYKKSHEPRHRDSEPAHSLSQPNNGTPQPSSHSEASSSDSPTSRRPRKRRNRGNRQSNS